MAWAESSSDSVPSRAAGASSPGSTASAPEWMPGRSTQVCRPTLLAAHLEDFGPQMGEYCVSRVLAVAQRLRYLESGAAGPELEAQTSPADPRYSSADRRDRDGGCRDRAGIRGWDPSWMESPGVARHGSPSRRVQHCRVCRRGGRAQWLVLACPLTEETFHLLNRDRLSACGAYLVNVGRGCWWRRRGSPRGARPEMAVGCGARCLRTGAVARGIAALAPRRRHHLPHLGAHDGARRGGGVSGGAGRPGGGRIPRLKVDLRKGY